MLKQATVGGMTFVSGRAEAGKKRVRRAASRSIRRKVKIYATGVEAHKKRDASRSLHP
jgi:hypothetical protein